MSNLADLTGRWIAADEERLKANREAQEATSRCEKARIQLQAAMEEAGIEATGNSEYVVQITSKPVFHVTDWNEVYSYILETNSFDLLQRRLGEKAVSLRWADGITIEGIEQVNVHKLKRTKRAK